jgi:hypothetical protein
LAKLCAFLGRSDQTLKLVQQFSFVMGIDKGRGAAPVFAQAWDIAEDKSAT